ncbi:MAG: MarR family winged helix-turn-helix transcriptional regulator [Pseudonocardiaceae bacterium]
MPEGPTTGYLLWRLSMKWRAACDRVLVPLGLTHAQFELLAHLHRLASLGHRPNQRELAEFSGLEPIYVSKLARALERSGLVERPDDPNDPRAVRLALTARGHAVLAAAITAVHELHAELCTPLGGPQSQRNRQLQDILRVLLGDTPLVHETHDTGVTTMTEPATQCGRYIHLAAHAIRTVRNTALGKAGITFTQWAVMGAVVNASGANREQLIHALVELTVDDESSIARAIDELHERGLVTPSSDVADNLELTTQGQALFRQVSATRTGLRNQLYDGIAAEDLAITQRVLDLITERARVVRAGL